MILQTELLIHMIENYKLLLSQLDSDAIAESRAKDSKLMEKIVSIIHLHSCDTKQ